MALPVINGRVLGCHRDAPHRKRGRVYRADGAELPRSAYLAADAALPILDQGRLGSCVGQAVSEAIYMREVAQGVPGATLSSRLWNYYMGRAVDGALWDGDCGTSFGSAFEGIAKLGFPPESAWPYDDTNTGSGSDPFRRVPGDAVYSLAYDTRIPDGQVAYHAIETTDDARAAIVANFPVLVGVLVDEAFCKGAIDAAKPVPPPTKPSGGHALVCVGYDVVEGELAFRIRNSWSSGFGDGGYCWFTAEYMAAGDLWIVERVPPQVTP